MAYRGRCGAGRKEARGTFAVSSLKRDGRPRMRAVMSSSPGKIVPEVNLDEFEKRLRAAGAPAGTEDPLAELTRLVNIQPRRQLASAAAQPLSRRRRKGRFQPATTLPSVFGRVGLQVLEPPPGGMARWPRPVSTRRRGVDADEGLDFPGRSPPRCWRRRWRRSGTDARALGVSRLLLLRRSALPSWAAPRR